jgi:hypothetical protein
LQRGQTLRAGRSRRHALALRLRLLALEVFFLGTAMSNHQSAVSGRDGTPAAAGTRRKD